MEGEAPLLLTEVTRMEQSAEYVEVGGTDQEKESGEGTPPVKMDGVGKQEMLINRKCQG